MSSYPSGIRDVPSPNFGEREGGVAPSCIILHYTGMKTAQEAIGRLRDPQAEVSAHYVVEENGSILRLVDEDKRAWHAGRSYWAGQTDMNSLSVGIEIVNPGHEFGYRAFTAPQMQAVIALCRAVAARHGMSPFSILAHSDIAPARKADPGELFDWRMMAGHGVGIWPVPEDEDRAAAAQLTDKARLHAAFDKFGYDPAADLEHILRAFQRHFHPEIFRRPDEAGSADPETVARLCALLRLKACAA